MAKKRATPRERRAEVARHSQRVQDGAASRPPMSPRTKRMRIVALVLVIAMVLSVMVSLALWLLGAEDGGTTSAGRALIDVIA